MKPILKFIGLVLLTGALVYVSCKKEYAVMKVAHIIINHRLSMQEEIL